MHTSQFILRDIGHVLQFHIIFDLVVAWFQNTSISWSCIASNKHGIITADPKGSGGKFICNSRDLCIYH